MKLKILQIGDPILEQKAKPVKNIKSKEVQELIDNMLDTCRANLDRTAGLSAPQVGKSLAISICRRLDIDDDADEWEIMINPKIVAKSEEETIMWEGCLSIGVGDKALYGPVARPETVTVEYLDRNGKKQELDADGVFSHVVQHEVDHVNGILFIKYVPNPDENLWLSKDLDNYLDEFGKFPEVVI